MVFIMNGVEIAFQLEKAGENDVVSAISNLTGNYFLQNELSDLKWQIFHVTLDKDKYYRVLYKSEKLNDIHPVMKKKLREKFDEYGKYNYDNLMELYNKEKLNNNFKIRDIKEITEEYDLWQDPLWNYI